MITIVHAAGLSCRPEDLPRDALAGDGMLVLAGPGGAFDALDLPEPPGRVGGRIIRLRHIQPEPSAFTLLADCLDLLRHLPAPWGALRYRRTGAPPAALDEGREVAWQAKGNGEITAFRLSPAAAGDPLLPVLTRELAGRPLSDARRFNFLAAALTAASAPAGPDAA